MIKPCFMLRCLRTALTKIHLVDKCLILFMIVLLAQSAFNLFSGHRASSETNNIDVIVRTSTASIFGYILSANFIRSATQEPNDSAPAQPAAPTLTGAAFGIQSRIGFQAPGETALPEAAGSAAADKNPVQREYSTASRLQIIVATSIGLFCLTVLILLRDIVGLGDDLTVAPSAAATIAQFRDLVSGCVGFLIGCPTATGKNR